MKEDLSICYLKAISVINGIALELFSRRYKGVNIIK